MKYLNHWREDRMTRLSTPLVITLHDPEDRDIMKAIKSLKQHGYNISGFVRNILRKELCKAKKEK